MSITVAELHGYPLKGGQAKDLVLAGIEVDGFENDRQWAIVETSTGMFVAQRNNPKERLGIAIPQICTISLSVTNAALYAPDMGSFHGSLRGSNYRPVQIWNWKGEAIDCGDESAEWCTTYLSRFRPGEYRLVRMPRDPARARPAKMGEARTRFNDAFPIHILSLASIEDLNRRRKEAGKSPVPTDRFRANILLDGCEPYEEDTFRRIQIDDVEFIWQKDCDRCVGINIIQANGDYDPDGPLGDLNSYRKRPDGRIYFGGNWNHCSAGQIWDRTEVKVLERA